MVRLSDALAGLTPGLDNCSAPKNTPGESRVTTETPIRPMAAPGSGSSSDDPLALEYTYTEVGTYTVEIAVWNCEMTVPATDTVEVIVHEPGVCVDLTAITIDGLASGTPGAYTFTRRGGWSAATSAIAMPSLPAISRPPARTGACIN